MLNSLFKNTTSSCRRFAYAIAFAIIVFVAYKLGYQVGHMFGEFVNAKS